MNIHNNTATSSSSTHHHHHNNNNMLFSTSSSSSHGGAASSPFLINNSDSPYYDVISGIGIHNTTSHLDDVVLPFTSSYYYDNQSNYASLCSIPTPVTEFPDNNRISTSINNNNVGLMSSSSSWEGEILDPNLFQFQLNPVIKSEDEFILLDQLHGNATTTRNSLHFNSYPLTSLSQDLTPPSAYDDVFHHI